MHTFPLLILAALHFAYHIILTLLMLFCISCHFNAFDVIVNVVRLSCFRFDRLCDVSIFVPVFVKLMMSRE